MVSCANVQNKEPHLKSGTVPEHFHVSEKRGKTNLEGADWDIYRVV